MRISDWSSDVCSSDLALARPATIGSGFRGQAAVAARGRHCRATAFRPELEGIALIIGRAGAGTARSGSGVAVVMTLQRHAEAFLDLAAFKDLPGFGLVLLHHLFHVGLAHQFGRSSFRERVCHYV